MKISFAPAVPAVCAVVLAFAAAAIADDEAAEEPTDMQKVAKGNSAFAIDLYGRLKSQPGNLFFSPFSVSAALAMTMAGARGNTEAEMAKVLRLSLTRETLHPALGALIADLNGRKIEGEKSERNPDAGKPVFELVLANSMFGQKGYSFLPLFLEENRKAYDAGFSELDFMADPEKSRLAINAWVFEKTRKRIRDILAPGQVTTDTRMALANALYFIAPWGDDFSVKATKEGIFRPAEGEPVKVQFMKKTDYFQIAETDSFSALVLPYRGYELVMVIVLPKAVDGLPAVEAGLKPEVFREIVREENSKDAEISIPKFRIESSFDLKDQLKAMGMKDAFSDKAADFSGMSAKKELFLGFVAHKSFVAVDEKGTEAAAATVAGVSFGGDPQGEFKFTADHPFLFAIADIKTGTLLFMGRVANPAK